MPQESPTIAALNEAIRELGDERMARSAAMQAKGTPDSQHGIPDIEDEHLLVGLDQFATRLQQIRQWLLSDDRLLLVVDDHIRQHVRKMEARQRRRDLGLSVGLTIVGAVFGWLLSALSSPIAVWHMVVH